MNACVPAGIARTLQTIGFVLFAGALAVPAAAAEREIADAAAAPGAEGELRVRLDDDVITGSSERPKVLYILPWRSAQATPGLDAAPDLKATELFDSLDPDAHGRQLRYRQRLAGDVADATQ